jgi:subtilisin family serine protease
MVMFAEDTAADRASGILKKMAKDLKNTGLTLVGQVPDLGIYQFEIENNATDPQEAIALLDTVAETLQSYEGVDTVSYNELLESRIVENDDDNSRYNGDDRCAFSVIDYYQAIPIFDHVLQQTALSDVTVAVIDSGLWADCGQFDDIMPRTQLATRFSGTPDFSDEHPRKHGTTVASIIAADNNDDLTNGIASRILGDRLHLVVGNAHLGGNAYSEANAIAKAQLAIELGARVVNFSLGVGSSNMPARHLTRLQNQFMRLFTASTSANVLFVAAASNDRLVLNNNDAPAGLPAANLITVGGLESCSFNQRYALSATGPGIDIAAPATHIPLCCVGIPGYIAPQLIYEEGNSFAAPIVSAMAAVVLSIHPQFTGAELKNFLIDENNVWPAPEEVGGKRVALIKTVGNAILQYAPSSAAVDAIMDCYGGFSDDIPDPSGHMINRLCGEVEFSVVGPSYSQQHSMGPTDISFSASGYNMGIIGRNFAVFNFAGGEDVLTGSVNSGLRLNEVYSITRGGPNGFGIQAGASGGGTYKGAAVAGTITFTECELTTRSLPLDWFSPSNPGADQLVFIEMTGTLGPCAAVGDIDRGGEVEKDVTYSVEGRFTTAFNLLFPDNATLEHLEQVCVGGYEYTP